MLVTGSTDGLGRRVAERLAAPDVHILVHGRDEARGREAVESITRAGGSARYLRADLASLDEVRAMAAEVSAEYQHLDGLINNAGVAQVDAPRRLSHDGHEMHFAVNYLALTLLTHLLRPLLGGSSPSRVINVTSAAQSPINFDDVMLERGYSGYRAYGQSKLAQIMFTIDAAEALDASNVVVNCLHPADHMDTGPVRAAGIRPTNSVDTGASAVIDLAADSRFGGQGGRYFNGHRESRASAQAYDPAARQRLRELTSDLLGLDL